jgi:mannosyltransferase
MGSFVQKHGVLLAILILAAFLRFYHLDTESLWGDEGASLRFAHMEGALEIVEGSRTDSNYPTYYLLLHYWVALFGDSDFSFRTPSALSGLFAVFAMYKVGYLLFGRGPALIASLILALSPIHIQYSQEARVYSLMVLSALLSFYFFVKILREQSFSSQTGYVLSTCLLLYSHIYGLLILLA